ncbi:MAG: tetratricopeptide repeat protein [Bryobacteraceae bacterium]
MRIENFFTELKRRNVYKVAVAYAVVSWLLVQAASILFPAFDAPASSMKILVIILAIGFPIALAFSWAFEITPEGIKRESEVAPNQSVTHHTGRRIIGLTIGLAVVAAGLLAFRLAWSPKGRVTVEGGAPATPNVSVRSESLAGTRPSMPIPEKSIAVLPFDNLSDDKSNAYFTEGIQDEILTRLSKIAALKVISRTSTQKYKSAPENLRDVGQQLGVAHVLEGSVQKIANAVHVNVQLIKAATDEHLWAESYNRKLDDVFAVEGEVATAIAEQLNGKLTGAEQRVIADKPTNIPAAYDAYLRGLSIEHNQYNYLAFQNAASAYSQAVQLDPKFALAWARLAVTRSFLHFNFVDRAVNTAAAVHEAADRAMALAPEAGESWIAEGAYRYRVLRNYEGAVTAYQEAQRRLPNNSFLLQNLAFVQRRLGRWQEAEISYKKALELDPLDATLLSSVGGEFYLYLRRFDDARAVLDRALQISPDSGPVHATKAGVFQNEGRLAEAAQELAHIPEDSTDDFVINSVLSQAIYERQFDRAICVIERKLNSIPPGQLPDSNTEFGIVQLGFCQDWKGMHREAQQTFARAVETIKPGSDGAVIPQGNGDASTLALAYAGLGQKQNALGQAQLAVKQSEKYAVNLPGVLTILAQIQPMFGDHDAAIAALPHLLEVPAGLTIADLKYNPFWDPLRKDPRFEKLCAEPNK